MIPIPPNETQRLAALGRLRLPAPPVAVFNHVAKVAQQHFQVPIALVSIVGSGRQVFAGRLGLDCAETPREHAFCAWSIMEDDVFVVEDAQRDPRFHANPLVTGSPFIRFYAGAPLVVDAGIRLGAACIVDHVPRTMNYAQKLVLRHIAEIAVGELQRFLVPSHSASAFPQ